MFLNNDLTLFYTFLKKRKFLLPFTIMANINEAHGEPLIKEIFKRNDNKKGSNKSLTIGSTEGSIKDIKAQIFTGHLKEEEIKESKQSSTASFKVYESESPPSMAQKSLPMKESGSTGSNASGECKTYITTSTGSIVTEKRGSSTPSSRSHKGSEESMSKKGSIKSHETSIKSTLSYGSEGPCRVYDTISLEKDMGRTSAEEIAYDTIREILNDNIPISAKDIVTDIVDTAVFKGSAKEFARGIIENMLPSSNSSLLLPQKSQDISLTTDDEYLKKHLGVPLTHALVEIVMKQPEDPIHYLAHWLFKWRWNQELKQQKEMEVNELTVKRQEIKDAAEVGIY